MDQKVKDIIDRAIYGAPEIKPEERNLFLTTIVERIYIALTKKQVIHKGMYSEVVAMIKQEKNAHLYVNGNLSYSNYSNYIQEANKAGIRFTIVTPQKQTPFGLVLAHESQAIDRTDIFVKDDLYELDMDDTLQL
ncbi:YueI family protein [Alkalihalobacillus sp. MEB130]|uniref:YueI family protein n=1 Tax=Alkalihalobacillus sp. MEB130 TaxID=2976704 RepID=UPI0028DF3133|nr:YueI family protein [Alkalihalobacillus sp. MEB130]MDT8861723.1 YueI family protein [Alkalihalobacillus sp. MEB130]